VILRPEYVGDTQLPWPEGDHAGPSVYYGDAHVDYHQGKWSLAGLERDHVLLSSVLLPLAGFPTDPVAVYWSENNLPKSVAPYWVDVGRQVLKGLPPPYDQIVFACPKEYATGLIKFLDWTALRTPSGHLLKSVRQRLPMVDWPLLRGMSVAPPKPPTVFVDLYGIETDTHAVVWSVPKNPWTDPISLVQREKPKARPSDGS